MVAVKIYKPAKTAMSSGRTKTKRWILLFERKNAQYVEPIMNWTGSTSTHNQIKLSFSSEDDAVAFAKKHGWNYRVIKTHERTIRAKSYTNNFTQPKLV